MKLTTKQKGDMGESILKTYLQEKGFKFVRSNYRTRYGEIDIIFKYLGFLIFIEAKTRKVGSKISGIEAVNYSKRQKIVKTACAYYEETGETLQPRFDVAEVLIDKVGNFSKINYIENAFGVVDDCACF